MQGTANATPQRGNHRQEHQHVFLPAREEMRMDTHKYIQFEVSRLGEPVNHSGANVI
jgi:hypothetical protein